MPRITNVIAATSLFCLIATVAHADDRNGLQLPDMSSMDFVIVKLPSQEEIVLTVPVYRQVEETYTVNVPVQEEREVDGRTVTVTRYVQEQRTRTRSVMASEQRAFGKFKLYRMTGKRVAPNEMAQLRGQEFPAIIIPPNTRVSPYLRRILKPETFVVILPPPPAPAASEVPAPSAPPAPAP